MDECYGIIKAIAKKHPEKVRPLKSRFIKGFEQKIIEDDNVSNTEAQDMSEKVWRIIEDNANYSFNSSHAYCMALDSLYNAWQKANYPYEFYEILMQLYSDKGNKDKVSILKQEMRRAFNINEGEYKFGNDNRKFVADHKNQVIYPSLLSIKGLSQKCSEELYELSQRKKYKNFYELWKDLKTVKSLDSGKIEILTKINYFKDFGSISKILNFLKCINDLFDRSQFNKIDISDKYIKYIKKYSETTEDMKTFRKFDYNAALIEIWNDSEDEEMNIRQQLSYEFECLGYIKTIDTTFASEYAYVQEYECKFTNPVLKIYRINNGDIDVVKVKKADYDEKPIHVGDLINTIEYSDEFKVHFGGIDERGKNIWIKDTVEKEKFLMKWSFVK
jgi:DNA polymerase III alpha subunit